MILILAFFGNIFFWAAFEQAGSSVNNFTDRNVDRVFESDTVAAADIGKSITGGPVYRGARLSEIYGWYLS